MADMTTANADASPIHIGMTPSVVIDGVIAKLECVNPCGSIKDRIAHYILTESLRNGSLKPGMRIVEATSGNTGIAFAYYGRALGFPVTIVMPEHMTEERKRLISSFGAELILCSEQGGFTEAAAIRDEIAANDPTVFNPDQFSNQLNVECHRLTTGEELIASADSEIDAFVAGVGTGGTLVGVGQALRNKWPSVHIAAVEPSEAAVMSGGSSGSHEIFGIGDGFIPAIAGDGNGGLHTIIDEVIVISSQDAIEAATYLRQEHGLCIGISSGANYLAAKQLKHRFDTVATVFADGYAKYRAQGLQESGPGQCAFHSRCSTNQISDLLE